jgi:hypothetical protein
MAALPIDVVHMILGKMRVMKIEDRTRSFIECAKDAFISYKEQYCINCDGCDAELFSLWNDDVPLQYHGEYLICGQCSAEQKFFISTCEISEEDNKQCYFCSGSDVVAYSPRGGYVLCEGCLIRPAGLKEMDDNTYYIGATAFQLETPNQWHIPPEVKVRPIADYFDKALDTSGLDIFVQNLAAWLPVTSAAEAQLLVNCSSAANEIAIATSWCPRVNWGIFTTSLTIEHFRVLRDRLGPANEKIIARIVVFVIY